MSSQDQSGARQVQQFFSRSVAKFPDNVALVCNQTAITYQELEERANQLANYLRSQRLGLNDVIAILLERSIDCYVTILAILKIGAAYVPIETDYPTTRINAIFADMQFQAVIISATQVLREKLTPPKTMIIDNLRQVIAEQSISPPPLSRQENEEENLCYVIYTSGSTGKPKGVEISHRSICHYVREASEIYQMTASDRVYQGFSLAFDASLEEIWMAFANGAALIACTDKGTRSGMGLREFLAQNKVSFFSTVPTLLATLTGELPDLRLLVLGGEVCPSSLVDRWHRPGLRIINTYGPTETTVIATYAECAAGEPVTIGQPLPGYELFILDENLRAVEEGQEGELFIGGCGLARGYVNCPTTSAKKFISMPLTQQRMYRTGDLVKTTPTGALQFVGRVDEQIKLRGFRIELNEVEAVMMTYPTIEKAVVSLVEMNQPALVAYILPAKGRPLDLEEFKVFLQAALPYYMIPSVFEKVATFPLLASGKVDRKKLPKPEQMSAKKYCPPASKLEKKIARVWEAAMQHESPSVVADFFYDLGGHSLLAAKVVSDLRKLPELQAISLLDLYQNPTIRQLALKFHQQKPSFAAQEKRETRQKNTTPAWKYCLCGLGQLAGCIVQYAIEAWQFVTIVLCYIWASGRYAVFSWEFIGIFLLLFMVLPVVSLLFVVVTKWLLLGRVKPGQYPLWSWFYFRWWLVNRLQKNVFSAKGLIGSPLINCYYRLLGAKIGKNCFIGSINIANHDLITIGDNTSIGYDARLLGYVVEDGWLKIGPINLGANCFVGARSVVNMGCKMEDNASLGDMSMLPSQTTIPAGQFSSGSPAAIALKPANLASQPTSFPDQSAAQSVLYGLLHYLCLFFTMTIYYCCYLLGFTVTSYFYENGSYCSTILLGTVLGAIVFLASYCFMLFFCKKTLLAKTKSGIYSLKSAYYLRYWTLLRMLDIDEIYAMADSLYLPFFLRCLGAKLGKQVEMGEAPHFSPDLLTVGEGGFTASSVALAWPTIHRGLISFSPVIVGKRAFVGNMGLLPGGAEIGEGGLLGCMSIPPTNNKASVANTAWLGSPAVFLPKRELVSGYSDEETFQPSRRLYFIRLAIEFIRIIMPSTFSFILLFSMLYSVDFFLAHNYSLSGLLLVMPAAELTINLALVAVFVLMKWTVLGKIEPLVKPVWSVFIWKYDIIEYLYCFFLNSHFINYILGTPFVAILFRCLGAKIGKHFFTDSNDFTEFDLISIGDNVCINSEVIIQTHLYEDRIFKMSTIEIQEGCNVGCASIVLYDTLMEKNSTLGTFSLLMKGEKLPANTTWAGIPAQSVSVDNCEVVQEVVDTVSLDAVETQ